MKAFHVWLALCGVLLVVMILCKSAEAQGYAGTAFLMVLGGGSVYLVCRR